MKIEIGSKIKHINNNKFIYTVISFENSAILGECVIAKSKGKEFIIKLTNCVIIK